MHSKTKEKKGGGEVKENISNNVKPPHTTQACATIINISLIEPKLCTSTNYVGTHYVAPT
jgi:hypothetical protein